MSPETAQLTMSLIMASAALFAEIVRRRRASEAPMPDDPNTPTPTPVPQTIGDLIAASATAATDQAAKADAAAAANAALAAANATASTADAALAAGLKVIGPAYDQDASGVVRVFYPDSSPRGFHVFMPSPVTTALTVTPEPAPAPAPDVPPSP